MQDSTPNISPECLAPKPKPSCLLDKHCEDRKGPGFSSKNQGQNAQSATHLLYTHESSTFSKQRRPWCCHQNQRIQTPSVAQGGREIGADPSENCRIAWRVAVSTCSQEHEQCTQSKSQLQTLKFPVPQAEGGSLRQSTHKSDPSQHPNTMPMASTLAHSPADNLGSRARCLLCHRGPHPADRVHTTPLRIPSTTAGAP